MAKCLLLMCLLMLCTTAYERCTQSIKVGIGTLTHPFIYIQDEAITGIDASIARFLLNKLGICPEFIKFPSMARAKQYLAVGRIYMLMGVAYTDQLNRSGIYSARYRDNVMHLFTHEPRLLKARTLIELLETSSLILHDNGQYAGPEVAYLKAQPKYQQSFTSVASVRQRLTMVNKHFADLTIENELAAKYFIQH